MRLPSLSILSELIGNLREEIIGVDGVVDERRSALVMDASAEGGPLTKSTLSSPCLASARLSAFAPLPRYASLLR